MFFTENFKKSLFGLSICLIATCTAKQPTFSTTKDTKIKVDQRAVYFITPWKEAVVSDRAQAISDAINLVQQAVQRLNHNKRLLGDFQNIAPFFINESTFNTFLNFDDFSTSKFEQTLIRAEKHMKLGADRVANLGIGFVDFVPTAIMAIIGGGASLKKKIGGGGGVHIALIIMPAKVVRIDKLTGKKTQRWKFLVSMNGILQGDLGAGVAASGGPTAGFGIIWGNLNHPAEFRGAAVGPHGRLQQAFGANWKVMALKRSFADYSIDNIFTTLVWGAGAGAETGITGNAIIPMEGLVKLMFGGGDSIDGPERTVLDEIENVQRSTEELNQDLMEAEEGAERDSGASN